jgi:deoxyribodipyrimidine photo-lyase
VPLAGREYQRQRNFDLGPGRHNSVSQLSAYIRHRILSEEEVLRAVLMQHSPRDAEKFIQEVFWRTYWKGWLEHRPGIWSEYLRSLNSHLIRLADEPGARDDYDRACEGRTDIEPFDAWVEELTTTGYLHNHARMWFASIWIFTLKLPWELGADLFLRHLLDGDPAANTLSWRWVAGLQTQGKTYLATAGNLEKYAARRFFSSGEPSGLTRLATQANPPAEATLPPAVAPAFPESVQPGHPCGLLLSEDDLLLDAPFTPDAVAIWLPESAGFRAAADQVRAFKLAAATDASQRAQHTWSNCGEVRILRSPSAVATWAAGLGLEQIQMAYVPQGHARAELDELTGTLRDTSCRLEHFIRSLDRSVWPHCSKGFFQLKKRIPELLASAGLLTAGDASQDTGQQTIAGV